MITWFVIDTIGATAPEFISAALARHPKISVLPGLAFVRDGTRLYRPHRFEDLDGADVFDRLWAPSFEPTGRMWAGLARNLPPEARTALDPREARDIFTKEWKPESGYAQTLFRFADQVAGLFRAWKPESTHLGFCGAPFLRTIDWKELIDNRIIVISSEVPLPIWLALVSHRSIVNCLDALHTWIIHGLIVAAARQSGVQIKSIDAAAMGRGGCVRPALEALGIESTDSLHPDTGPGHMVFDAGVFNRTEVLASELEAVFAGNPLYEFSSRVTDWAPTVIRSERIRHLVDLYIQYWRSTAHIHFDTVGPLEREIVHSTIEAAPEFHGIDTRSFQQRFSQNFFFETIQFRSYSFETPSIALDTYLGDLEALTNIPCAPYFVHAALCYLERALDRQKKWFDSYISLAESHVYRTLCSEKFRRVMDTNGFEARIQELQKQDRELSARAAARAAGNERGGDNVATGL